MKSSKSSPKSFWQRICIILLILVLPIIAKADISIEGLSGLTLNISDDDYTIDVSSSFTFRGIEIKPGPDNFKLQYNSGENVFSLWGSGSKTLDGHPVNVTFGSESEPGIRISSSEVTHFEGDITGEFVLKALDFKSAGAGFSYDNVDKTINIFGGIDFTYKGNVIVLFFSDASTPGIVVNNGNITKIEATVTSDMHLYGSTFKTESLGLSYNSTSQYFNISGGASVKIGSNDVQVNFAAPGVAIFNGQVTNMEFAVTGDIHVGGLVIQSMGVVGSMSANQFVFGGKVKTTVGGQTLEAKLGKTTPREFTPITDLL